MAFSKFRGRELLPEWALYINDYSVKNFVVMAAKYHHRLVEQFRETVQHEYQHVILETILIHF
jgi:hypothetical protein